MVVAYCDGWVIASFLLRSDFSVPQHDKITTVCSRIIISPIMYNNADDTQLYLSMKPNQTDQTVPV